VRPTERGAAFLQHAHNILREMESIQMMSPHQMIEDRLRICIPRSAVCFQNVANYLKTISEIKNIHAEVRECHAKKALELLSGGHAEIGIIRFRKGYEDYFKEVASASKLSFRLLHSYDDVVVFANNHPLAAKDKIKLEDLAQYIQIAHSDNYFSQQPSDEKSKSLIYTVDRQAQITLLNTISNSYMWSVPQDAQVLANSGLVQKHCSGYSRRYCEALIYSHQHTMNQLESELLNEILANSNQTG